MIAQGICRRGRVLALAVLIGLIAGALALAAPGFASSQDAHPCTVHIRVSHIPQHVRVTRNGHPLPHSPPPNGHLYLQRNDKISLWHNATFPFSYAGNSYRLHTGSDRLTCEHLLVALGSPRRTVLAINLKWGLVDVTRGGSQPHTAAVVTPEMVALGTRPRTRFEVRRKSHERETRASTLSYPILAIRRSDPSLRIDARRTYTAISDRSGLRLDAWPFSLSPRQRRTTKGDNLVPFWADGRTCSVGCRAPGTPGWPLKPFHEQHAIRSAINELRPSGFHVALDIEAKNAEQVYPIESGYVHIRYPGTADVNVDVGHFDYWHVMPRVHNGQYVTAYKTVLGKLIWNFKHVAFSEIGPGGQYLNPLRPGASLLPYTDTEPPVIGVPRIFSDGRVIDDAFDPQSFIDFHTTYETPVLAPAALAWRIYNSQNRAVTALNWALRGSQVYPPSLIPRVFAPGAKNPGFNCFAFHRVCIPHWNYWLAGGLTERLPLSRLGRGRYRLAIYAWDWKGNTSALDYWFRVPLAGPLQKAPSGRPVANFDYP